MNRKTYGLLAAIAGAAIGAWWWQSRSSAPQPASDEFGNKGTVIFDNTPHASSADGVL